MYKNIKWITYYYITKAEISLKLKLDYRSATPIILRNNKLSLY